MKGALEVPGFHSADKVGIYRQQQQAKFDWDCITTKINKGCAPKMFCFSSHDVTNEQPKTLTDIFSCGLTWELLQPSCSCLLTLSEFIHSRPDLWRPQVLSSHNPWTAHSTQKQMQQIQGQCSAPATLSHSSSLSTLRAKNIVSLFYKEETEPPAEPCLNPVFF